MKHLLFLAVLSFHVVAFAGQQGCDCKGTTGGLSAAHGHFGGSNSTAQASHASASPGQSAQGGQGGSYWTPGPNASLVDAYQPWPESEMRRFQKP